jgi:hypothetical protein
MIAPAALGAVLLLTVPVSAWDALSSEVSTEAADAAVAGPEQASGSGAAQKAESKEEKKKSWYDKVSYKGDFRLRYEHFNWEDNYDDGRRNRFRFRLRFGFEAQVSKWLALGFQLRSGNPKNPISDNQSLDTSFGKKTIAIAEAYADLKPTETFSAKLGKFAPKGLWTVSDLQWDDDVIVEGALEKLAWKPGGAVKTLDVNLYQFVLNESGSGVDSYMLGGQIVPVFDLGDANDLMVGAGYETVAQPDKVVQLYLDEELVTDAAYGTNFIDPETGKLISDFDVASFFAEWKNKSIDGWPIKVTAYFYKNFGAGDGMGAIFPVDDDQPPLVFGRGTDNDTGWFGRIQAGDYKKTGQVAVRYTRYDSKPDAMFFAYAQSDSRRASNVDGHRVDFRVGMPHRAYINVTWYNTRWTLGSASIMNRWQFDYIFRF